jgi:hypothetical protein
MRLARTATIIALYPIIVLAVTACDAEPAGPLAPLSGNAVRLNGQTIGGGGRSDTTSVAPDPTLADEESDTLTVIR